MFSSLVTKVNSGFLWLVRFQVTIMTLFSSEFYEIRGFSSIYNTFRVIKFLFWKPRKLHKCIKQVKNRSCLSENCNLTTIC